MLVLVDLDESRYYTALEYNEMKSELLSKNNQLQKWVLELEKSVSALSRENNRLIADNRRLEMELIEQKASSKMSALEEQNNELKNKFNRIYDILEER